MAVIRGVIAQLVEHRIANPVVPCSTHGGTFFFASG